MFVLSIISLSSIIIDFCMVLFYFFIPGEQAFKLSSCTTNYNSSDSSFEFESLSDICYFNIYIIFFNFFNLLFYVLQSD